MFKSSSTQSKHSNSAGDTDKKLDLTSIQSYSPEWPHELRLAVAIAVQYAGMRHVQRAEAIHKLLYPEQAATASASSSQDDDLVQRDEDGNVQGKLQGYDRTQRVRADYDLVEAWRDYTRKFATATCQHLGIAEETLPPGSSTLEDIRLATRGRPIDGDEDTDNTAKETEFEMGTAHASTIHEGTGQRAKEVKAEEKDSQKESEASKRDDELAATFDEKLEVAASRKALEADMEAAEEQKSKRTGGLLDKEPYTRYMEIVNELLLIALGMGQHRAEDGSTTLFEQDAIFGDADVHAVGQAAAAKEAESSTDSENASAEAGQTTKGGEATNAAWGALSSGFSSIKRGSVNLARQANLSSASTDGTAKPKKPPTTKPNEPCHYDARARALIFVAVTAMDVAGLDVYMAEKIIAQTIYFIMSDGRKASKEGGKGDPLAGMDDGESSSERRSWMNRASQGIVNREKGKADWAKWAAMGAGATVGGVLIGVTGGLAAPLVAPALVGLTGVSFLATTGGVVMMATLLGVGGAGLAGYRVQRRLRGIDKFEFHEVPTPALQAGVRIPSLHATVCCGGLLLKNEKQGQVFDEVFAQTPDNRDVFTIHAEEGTMQQAGEGLRGYVLDTALKSGGQKVGTEVLKHTALAGIAALTLPLTAWTAASAALDGVFVQAKSRAYRAGLILADVLKDEVQGHRPIILIGTSLGCVTILTALSELAKSPEENAHLVDSVLLIGAPASPSPATLRRARSVVSRRFVNAFSARDMVCAVAAWLGSGISVEEAKSGALPRIMGSRAVLGVPGVENIDVSDLVPSHFSLNDAAVLREVLTRCRATND